MFGDETTSDSVRPLSPPVSNSGAKKLVFFESDRQSDTGESDPVVVQESSLFPDLVFDPTATGAYAFDLSEPQNRADEQTSSRSDDPSATSEESIIDLARPDPGFSVPFPPKPPFAESNALAPSTEGWLQQSLFSTDPPTSSTVQHYRPPAPDKRSLLDRLNYGNIEDLEDVRWFHRPIIWLVFGLLTVLVLFIALLLQDDASAAEAARLGLWVRG